MDLKTQKYFWTLLANGRKLDSGNASIMEIARSLLLRLGEAKLKTSHSGFGINLLVTNQPAEIQETVASMIESVDETLTHQLRDPESNESYSSYLSYLLSTGLPEPTAAAIAAESFNLTTPATDKLTAWLNDPLAVRFRALNTSNSAFASALPDEYQRLKTHCLNHFPEFVSKMTLRSAN